MELRYLSNGVIIEVVMFGWNEFLEGGKEIVRMLYLIVVEMWMVDKLWFWRLL